MAKLTPMMQQYFEIKDMHKNCLLFFRLGDFYEMFFDDAVIASKELDITLTGRDCGQEERAPMCGVPFHSADGYIARLIEKGYNVAICEQVEDPKFAQGIVKREVIRIITPGTVLDTAVLDDKKNNYIMCIYANKNGYGISFCDVTTGEFVTSEQQSINALQMIIDETAKYNPSEIICNEDFKSIAEEIKFENRFRIKLNICDKWMFDYNSSVKLLCGHFKTLNLEGFGLKDKPFAVCASGGLLAYLINTQKNSLEHIYRIKLYSVSDFMVIDNNTRKNLELTETMREKNKKGSLLWVLDRTKTSMGARLFKKWINQPLIDVDSINSRLSSVEELKEEFFIREELKEVLSSMQDFERIMSKVVYQTANCRDLVALKNSIENLPLLKEILKKCKSAFLKELCGELDTLENICRLIEISIVEEPPFSVREGGMIKRGYNEELDVFLKAKSEGTAWINELEQKEKTLTGIKNLKIRYNRVFGYYIEVTKSNLQDVPERYLRKQTLANCERYVTEELNKLQELILGAEEKIVDLEYKLFCEIRNAVSSEVKRIQYCAYIVASADCIQGLADAAQVNNYKKPIVSDKDKIFIKNGRHPVVEKLLSGDFVPNDVLLDCSENRLLVITGPNMAGKSTYMRQTALITLMAQIGSFVPAEEAEIGIVDRIFTRVGASDDLTSGQSTFMVEMVEVANILHNATGNSLLILDEIGRGTSTFDGLSIAWAVIEFIADTAQIGAKTLFSTHYHELTELEGKLSGVKNYCIPVKEDGDDIIFLRRIVRGGADNSYGVQVAKLAGLPNKVIKRSLQILKQLNAADITKKAKKIAKESAEEAKHNATQLDMFSVRENQLTEELSKIDVMALTPIEAMQKLFDLQKKAKGM